MDSRKMESFLFIAITFAWLLRAVVFSLGPPMVDYDIRDLLRRQRSLLFPDPMSSETKLQVLFGLGLPMEGEVSMTLGYVLKCNYELPYNSSDFTNEPYVRYVRSETPKKNTRPRLNKTGAISRWSLYRILEMAMDSSGTKGKVCLLRAVCEAAESPFDDGSRGLLGQLLHVLLTPSTSSEDYELYEDREYSAAEIIGRESDGHECGSSYHECDYSPLDYFTKINRSLLP